ncbi:hypothetical protein BU23DRAFT_626947 [Bimuria novae-zelandiae CBS 107.79]|uniref:Zn(2)-C6 fungal-type domain-containing protein n=1 Tax=Bimuria novae-zelandiae CBS 107.79 TaxID=1447943 RepID=A0A6A5UKE9_9PLEO|nr:hypothetical protein BU23DRAFT_626947 [Bimuria novae-zelandiae CBS 107.79]
MKKRTRACEECHRLKIKCDLSTSPAGAGCERCSRNNLACVPSAPRLQRDRISELEAQIRDLTAALRDQSSSTPSSRSPGSLLEDHNEVILSFLDSRIPLSKQQDLLHLFNDHIGASWPVIRLSTKVDYIRSKSPILLLSVLAFTATHLLQGTQLEVHDELVRETMQILGEEVISRGQRSLEIVQALLVAAFWNKTTRRGGASCYQLIQLAADMAIDIGIAGFSLQPSPVAYFDQHEDTTSAEARRTWLACFVALSSSSKSLRRPNVFPWNLHHQECLLYLESRGEPSDLLLCQIVRIKQLTQEISEQLGLFHLATFVDGNDHSTHTVIKTMKNNVEAWAAQIPPILTSSQTLQVWYHVTMVHIHEVALHTPTNKPSFVPPFIPGRIPVKYIPKPANIIFPLRTALEALVYHCHGVINTVTEMDPALVLNLPSFSFSPNIVYTLFVLVTTMVAATDPANAYGQCLPKDCFRIEECSVKLRGLAAGMKSLDPTLSCWTTRMVDATSWLEEWYKDYTAILRRYEMNLAS